MLYRKAGLLHQPQELRKVGGLLFQSRNDGKPYPLLGRRGPLPDPLAIVQETALAVKFRMLDNR